MKTAKILIVRSAAIVVIGLSSMTTIAGCAAQNTDKVADAAPTSSAPVFGPADDAISEYVEESSIRALPPGVAYPEAPFAGRSGSFEKGYGAGAAVTFWNCAWGKAYLRDEAANASLAGQELEQYASVQSTDTFKRFWDPESMQVPFKKSIESAKLGDPSAIERNVSANCA